MEKTYTFSQLLLACKEEYEKQAKLLGELEELSSPASFRGDKVKFKLEGSLKNSSVICEVYRKINWVDKLIKRSEILCSYNMSKCDKPNPIRVSNVKEFDEILSQIMTSDYFTKMGNVSELKNSQGKCIIQTSVNEISLRQNIAYPDRDVTVEYTIGDCLYRVGETDFADVLNAMNYKIPSEVLSDYQKELLEKSDLTKSFKVVDYRKMGEVEEKSPIVLLKTK